MYDRFGTDKKEVTKMKVKKKLLSILLALVMLLGMLPLSVMASGEGDVAINAANFPDANFREFVKQYDDDSKEIPVKDNGDGTYSFKMPAGKVTVSATFKEKESDFTDVTPDDWFYDAVEYVSDNGLMNGVGNNMFDPQGTTTRAMIVTILYRLEGQPDVSGSSPFDDVASGQWYTDAVIWANANGIVLGYGNGKFGPNDLITREQFAAIMYRYANFKGYDTSKAADLSGYTDAGSISGYAVEAMKWANAENLITGRTATTLVPRGEATRAEAAAILMRFINSQIIGDNNMAEGVIRQLQKEIAFGEQDIVTFFSNGYLKSIDIKTQKTAEMLFMCIRNCEGITDLTDVNLEPMALPIEINGQGMGTFRELYITYQETGQFICISFTPEDSERFQDYVMSLR